MPDPTDSDVALEFDRLADEAETAAGQMSIAGAREAMLGVALGYRNLAEWERRASAPKPPATDEESR